MFVNERHAVVGDIGGTHARFGIADIDELRIDHYASFECSAFGSLNDVLDAYLRSVPTHPRAVSLAVAGPVANDAIKMTNLPWYATKQEIAKAAGAEHVCLLNDFHAAALSLPHLSHHDLVQIGGSASSIPVTKVVLGPGTGLGVAALVRAESRWIGVPGEGGHISFAAQTQNEFDIVSRLRRDFGHASSEYMLSGAGLVRLYGALGAGTGAPLDARSIVHRATADDDPVAKRTLNLFAVWLGRFAGDMALLFAAHGGVYLAGGIAPNMIDFLSDGEFRAAFEAKGRASPFLKDIPVYIVKNAQTGLIGAAVALGELVDGPEQGE